MDLDAHDIAILDGEHHLLFDRELATPKGQRLRRLEAADLVMIGSTGSVGFVGAMEPTTNFTVTERGKAAAASWAGQRLLTEED